MAIERRKFLGLAAAGTAAFLAERALAQSRTAQAIVDQVGGVSSIPTETPTPLGELLIRVQGTGPADPSNLWRIDLNPNSPSQTMVGSIVDIEPPFEWSPLGDKFLTYAKNDGGTIHQWSVRTSSGQVERWINRAAYGMDINTFDVTKEQAGWHPSGEQVLIPGFGSGIYAIGVKTGLSTKLISSVRNTWDHNPTFSPDGSKLAFVHHPDYGTQFYLYMVNFDWAKAPYAGVDPDQGIANPQFSLIDQGPSDLYEPIPLKFTSDGRKVVYINNSAVHSYDLTSGANIPYYIGAKNKSFGFWDMSPVDNKLAVVCESGLNILDLNSASTRVLYPHSGIQSPKFSPSGKFVAVVENQDMAYFDTVTGDRRLFNDIPTGNVLDFDWSYYRFLIKQRNFLPSGAPNRSPLTS